MRNFDETLYNAFYNGNYSKKMTLSFSNGITIKNDGIVGENFKITQTLCNENALTFGKVCPSQLYVKIYDTQHSYKGSIVDVLLKVTNESNEQVISVKLGTYIITSDSRTSDKTYRELIGYDSLYQLSKYSYLSQFQTYSSGSTKKKFSVFVKDFLDACVSAISCTYDNTIVQSMIATNLKNVIVNGNASLTSLSYLDVLQMICECMGCFCYLDFNGKLRFVTVKSISNQLVDAQFTSGADGTTTDESTRKTTAKKISYSASDYLLGGFTYQDFLTANYTQLTITADLLNGSSSSSNQTSYTVGTDGVNYTVRRNHLTKGWNVTQLSYIVESWNGLFAYNSIGYTPSNLNKPYDPRIELGDYISVTTTSNETIVFPVLKRVIQGIVGIKDNYVAPGSELTSNVGVSLSSTSGATVGYAQVDLSNIKGACILNSYIKDSTITGAKIADSTLTNAHIVDATIDYAKMNSAFVSNLTADQAFVNELQTNVLTAEFIQGAVANVGYLRAEYVQADQTYSLISTIGQLSAELSLLKDVHITQSGKISGYLDAVEVNANSITAGKLIADYIYLKGENGLLYQFNLATQYSLTDDMPSDWATNYTNYYIKTYSLTTSKPSDWETNYYTDYYVSNGQGGYTLVQKQQTVPTWQANTYYRVVYTANNDSVWVEDKFYRLNSNPSTTTLDGSAITNRTITADHIVAGTITANEIASGTITAEKIGTNAITSDKISANAITTDKINANAITGNKIASRSITADKLSVTSLSAISSNIGTITAGSITGTTIKGNTISGGSISGTTISGGSINIGNGTFTVNANGNMVAKSGNFGIIQIDDDSIDFTYEDMGTGGSISFSSHMGMIDGLVLQGNQRLRFNIYENISMLLDINEGVVLKGGSMGVHVDGDLFVGSLSTSNQNVRGAINELATKASSLTRTQLTYHSFDAFTGGYTYGPYCYAYHNSNWSVVYISLRFRLQPFTRTGANPRVMFKIPNVKGTHTGIELLGLIMNIGYVKPETVTCSIANGIITFYLTESIENMSNGNVYVCVGMARVV